jgi:hypothetical protein
MRETDRLQYPLVQVGRQVDPARVLKLHGDFLLFSVPVEESKPTGRSRSNQV